MTLACRLFALLMIASATASGCPAWAQTTNRLPLEREDMPRFEERLEESRGYWTSPPTIRR
ncbi:MAG: hypothetical protein KY476_12390 [Planctomycetes bacterium]|nr:hypothetical protein [Planctomycetota bacterium]